jgi:hypothetical protein
MRTTIRLPADLIRDLKSEARRRGLAADELAALIIGTVSTERLFDAVLGRIGEAVERRSPRRSDLPVARNNARRAPLRWRLALQIRLMVAGKRLILLDANTPNRCNL